MCGILGVIQNNNNTNIELFNESLNLMIHRGPDGFGIIKNNYICFGHRRLSIIDLSINANQPLTCDEENLIIVFNGEIYNYNEISTELNLITKSDTEVLLKGYRKYGIDFFKKIRGAYSFCIYDNRDSKDPKCIFLRDPAGVKPLYINENKNSIVFASEIKSILPLLSESPTIDEKVIKQFIHLGYCPEPNTAFNEIKAIVPGVCTIHHIISKQNELFEILTYSFDKIKISKRFATSKTKSLLEIACKRNMVADVKINIALSGGIDSSLIFALVNKQFNNSVTGITISFDEKEYDESKSASIFAKHIGAPIIITKTETENKLELLDKIILHFDQPFADSSCIPFYFLSKEAAKYSKVLIGGDSGDEIHNGYIGYKFLPFLQIIKNCKLHLIIVPLVSMFIPFVNNNRKRLIRKIIGLLKTKNMSELMFFWESWFPPDNAMYPTQALKYNFDNLAPKINEKNIYSFLTNEYFTIRMLSDYLRKSDMMSMLNSVEFRVPMLDEDLTQFSLKIPYKYKSSLNKTKIILKKLHSTIYPKWLSKLPKKGFTIPLDTWLGEENLDLIKKILLSDSTFYTKYVSKEYTINLFDDLKVNKSDDYVSRASIYQRILILYSLELWFNKHFSNK